MFKDKIEMVSSFLGERGNSCWVDRAPKAASKRRIACVIFYKGNPFDARYVRSVSPTCAGLNKSSPSLLEKKIFN